MLWWWFVDIALVYVCVNEKYEKWKKYCCNREHNRNVDLVEERELLVEIVAPSYKPSVGGVSVKVGGGGGERTH